jgi:hypothetical protein
VARQADAASCGFVGWWWGRSISFEELRDRASGAKLRELIAGLAVERRRRIVGQDGAEALTVTVLMA